MTFINGGIGGVDISKWQDDPNTAASVDFQKLKDKGASFVILRIGQGNFVDRAWATYRINSRGILPRAGYWFFDPRYDPEMQADICINAIGTEQLEGRVWLDLEFNWPGTFHAPRHWRTFQDRLKAAGFRTGVYTRQTWWEGRGADMTYWGREPFWLAQYNTELTLIPSGLIMPPMIWQDRIMVVGPEWGVESFELDHDIWNSYFSFSQEWGEYPVPPQELPMARYEAVSTFSMSIRPQPNTNNSPYGSVLAGNKMHGDTLYEAPGERWLKVTDINGLPPRDRNNVLITGDVWVAIVHNNSTYCHLTDSGPQEPPASLPDTLWIGATPDDVREYKRAA